METHEGATAQAYRELIEIGIALSAEKDPARLRERILAEAKRLANADAGTLYLKHKGKELHFQIVRNDSLGIALGGTTGLDCDLPPVPLVLEDGRPNMHNVASYCAITGEIVNIADAYDPNDPYDFSGTEAFDRRLGYRSHSFLTVPLMNHNGMVIGVLQLINAKDATGKVVPFDPAIVPMVSSLASQAAVSIDNRLLIEELKLLLDSFIGVIATAIDTKSPYTGGHCQRVPVLTEMLVKAACDVKDGPFAGFDLTEEEWYELRVACWLHDCGKVITPEHIVDKATKLECIYDRIHEIRMRFEVLKRDAEIAMLKAVMAGGDPALLREKYEQECATLDEEFAFVGECNVGGEYMAPEKVERLQRIAERTWMRTLSNRIGISYAEQKRREAVPERPLPIEENLLADRPDHISPRQGLRLSAEGNPWGFKMKVPEREANLGELYNLSISRGTLTEEDRYRINEHMAQTIIMLESLPWPRHLRRVPEYAGGHHEKIDGTGYPRGLRGEDMSIPARVMAIADIFEALTAADRPYKPPKKVSDALRIMRFMVKDKHIDAHLFRLFVESGVYREYAVQHLKAEQIDEVDLGMLLDGLTDPPPAAAPAPAAAVSDDETVIMPRAAFVIPVVPTLEQVTAQDETVPLVLPKEVPVVVPTPALMDEVDARV
ncbi:GAF and HD-GYP domain-containing protein [Ramlibacter albus]|uniref:GAF domain-containing protein n=1 Tax=Ramlibacter albus TaxID=2079448 RepID=A0A923S2T8_9BURK|nr:HD family phosphohydrolase [Ramlibacter albus]MBC5765740.1 GAF domain-containing protein [Ramlibacter albus]